MSPELGAKPCEEYPKIFVQHSLPMTQTAMCWGCDCGDGWLNLIDDLCEKLQSQTDKHGAPQLEALQVKEKFGGLRFYVRGSNDAQHALIGMAEVLSTRTWGCKPEPPKIPT